MPDLERDQLALFEPPFDPWLSASGQVQTIKSGESDRAARRRDERARREEIEARLARADRGGEDTDLDEIKREVLALRLDLNRLEAAFRIRTGR